MINDLSIVVLSKDEGKNLISIIPKIKKISKDVLVVDGHSTDNTKEICKKLRVRYFVDGGLGKGDAQRVGANKAKKKYIIFFDGDGAPDIKDIKKIRKKLNKYDLVICSRTTGGSYDLDFSTSLTAATRAAGCIMLTYMVNRFFKCSFTDVLYSFKGISKKKFSHLKTKSNGFEIELDILLRALRKNFKICELPSRENARKYGVSKLSTLRGIIFIFFVIWKKFFD